MKKQLAEYSTDMSNLEKVERELRVVLPQFLWEFYRGESQLIRSLRNIAQDEEYIVLTTDFIWMIEYNRDFLRLPTHEGICRNKICIGTDGCGNDSFIALSDADKRVFRLDHDIADELFDEETNDFRWEDERLEKYASLQEYVASEIEAYKVLGKQL